MLADGYKVFCQRDGIGLLERQSLAGVTSVDKGRKRVKRSSIRNLVVLTLFVVGQTWNIGLRPYLIGGCKNSEQSHK